MTTLWKMGGAICDRTDVLDALARVLDGPAVVVHGAGPQLDAALRKLVGEPVRIAGLRVTTPAAANEVCHVMDEIGAQLTQLLQQRGVDAVHVPTSSRWLSAAPMVIPDGDLQRVGDPTIVDVAQIQALLDAGHVPVLSPAGWDQHGPLNVNADDAACAAATALQVDELALMSDIPAVLKQGARIAAISRDEAITLIQEGHATGGMIPKLRAALDAIEAGVGAVRIGNMETLLSGQGTRISEVITSTGTT